MWIAPLLAAIATALTHLYSSKKTPHEKEMRLKEHLSGRQSNPIETKKENEFTVSVVGERVEVYEASGLFYKYVLKPLPILGGFRGMVDVELVIDGDVWLEEWALIAKVANHEEYHDLIGQLELENDRLRLTFNTVDERELSEAVTGVRRMLEQTNQFLVRGVIEDSDEKVLGETVAGGIARPIVIEVSFPTTIFGRLASWPLKRLLLYIIGPMERSLVWVRHTPYWDSSQVKYRIQNPRTRTSATELSAFESLSLINPVSTLSDELAELFKVIYIGYGVRRDMIERGQTPTTRRYGTECLPITLSYHEGKAGFEGGLPVGRAIIDSLLDQNLDRYEAELMTRTQVHIPLRDVQHQTLVDIWVASERALKHKLNRLIEQSDGDVILETVTGQGRGVIQTDYRGGDGSWYFNIRWSPTGNAKLVDVGRVNPAEPLETEGYIMWERVHTGQSTLYQPA